MAVIGVLILIILVLGYFWYQKKQEYELVKKELGEKSAELIDLVKKAKNLEDELSATQVDLKNSRSAHEGTKATLAQAKKDLAAALAKSEARRIEIARLRGELKNEQNAHKATRAKMQEELDRLTLENTNTKELLSKAQQEIENQANELRQQIELVKKLEGDNAALSGELAWARKALFEADDYILSHYFGENKEMVAKLRRLRDVMIVVASTYKGVMCNTAKETGGIWPFTELKVLPEMTEAELTQPVPYMPWPSKGGNHYWPPAISGRDNDKPLLTCPPSFEIKDGSYQYMAIPPATGGKMGPIPNKCIGQNTCALNNMHLEVGDPVPNKPKMWTIKYTCQTPVKTEEEYNAAMLEYRLNEAKRHAFYLYRDLNQICVGDTLEKQMVLIKAQMGERYDTYEHVKKDIDGMFGSKQGLLNFIDAIEPLLLDMRNANCKSDRVDMERIKAIYNKFTSLVCGDDPNIMGLLSKPLDLVLAKSAQIFLG